MLSDWAGDMLVCFAAILICVNAMEDRLHLLPPPPEQGEQLLPPGSSQVLGETLRPLAPVASMDGRGVSFRPFIMTVRHVTDITAVQSFLHISFVHPWPAEILPVGNLWLNYYHHITCKMAYFVHSWH